MGLVSYTQLEDGTDALANDMNERFGKIYGEFNGNIDSANLKNSAVTREKIAPQAITSDKLLVKREYDQDGWLVTDYGGYKRYTRTGTFDQTAAGNIFGYLHTDISFPSGCTAANIVGCYVAATDQAISIGFSQYYPNKISFNYQNKYSHQAPLKVTWTITFEW